MGDDDGCRGVRLNSRGEGFEFRRSQQASLAGLANVHVRRAKAAQLRGKHSSLAGLGGYDSHGRPEPGCRREQLRGGVCNPACRGGFNQRENV